MAFSPTRTQVTIQASTSCGAGSSVESSPYDMNGKISATLVATITNGSGTLTGAPKLVVWISGDNDNWRALGSYPTVLTDTAVTTLVIPLPREVRYVKTKFDGNTGNAMTVECLAHIITEIS